MMLVRGMVPSFTLVDVYGMMVRELLKSTKKNFIGRIYINAKYRRPLTVPRI